MSADSGSGPHPVDVSGLNTVYSSYKNKKNPPLLVVSNDDDRIFVPLSLRHSYLLKVHAGHLGAESTKQRAKKNMFWPKMSKDIEQQVTNCSTYINTAKHHQKELSMLYPVPISPWSIGIVLTTIAMVSAAELNLCNKVE